MKTQFEQEVLSLRVDKDSFLRNDIESPIPPNERTNFKGLNYFPPRLPFHFEAETIRHGKAHHNRH